MNVYLLQIMNGVGIGMIYFVLAAGLSIVLGLLGFVNFAHGAFYVVGAYVGLEIAQRTGSFWAALVLAPLAVAALGVVAERLLLSRTYRMPHVAQILGTFGLALGMREVVIILWGPEPLNVAVPPALAGVVIFGGFPYPKYRLFIVCIAAAVALALGAIMEWTRYGATVRAGSESQEMVGLLGIDVPRLFTATFALGAGLAGLAGAVAGPLRGADPAMGAEAIAIAFVVVVLTGMGSTRGTIVGALIVGVVQSVMSTVWPEGARLAIFGVMAATLLLLPRGLFGRA